MTGKHADIILTDDIVNLQDRISAVERKRICGVYQELQNIRNPGGRILNTGTPWHPDDAFRLMPPPEKYDCYQTGLLTKDAMAAHRDRRRAVRGASAGDGGSAAAARRHCASGRFLRRRGLHGADVRVHPRRSGVPVRADLAEAGRFCTG